MDESNVQDKLNEVSESELGDKNIADVNSKDNIVNMINEIYSNGDIIKQELVAALVAKGLEATTDMSFDDLINTMDTNLIGVDASLTATAGDVLSGKTFINSTGELITGTLVNNGTVTLYPNLNDTYSKGTDYTNVYYDQVTIKGDANLKASNIKEGVTLFGVKGTYWNQKHTSGYVDISSFTVNGRSRWTVNYPKTLIRYPDYVKVVIGVSSIDFFTNSSQTSYVRCTGSEYATVDNDREAHEAFLGSDFTDSNGSIVHRGIFYLTITSYSDSYVNVEIDWSYSQSNYGCRINFSSVNVTASINSL